MPAGYQRPVLFLLIRGAAAQVFDQRRAALGVIALVQGFGEVEGMRGLLAPGRVEQAVWDGIVESVVLAGREDRLREGIVTAVRAIGAVLANHAPRSPDDVDELPNNVVIL